MIRSIIFAMGFLASILLSSGGFATDETQPVETDQVADSASVPDSTPSTVDSLPPDSSALDILENIIDTSVIIPKLEFVELNLDDALKALVRAYNLSAFIDTTVVGTINLRFDNVSLKDALLFIINEYDLAWERIGGIIKIYKPGEPPLPLPPLEMSVGDGLFSCNLKNVGLQRFVDALIDMTGINIIIETGTSGLLSGRLQQISVDKALEILMDSNGYSLRSADGIYYISSVQADGQIARRATRFSINCENQLVTINVSNAPLNDILSAISDNCAASFFIRGKVEGSVSASFTGLELENALGSLLRDTPYTYKKEGEIFFIGLKSSEDMFVSELILLQHLVAEDIEPLVPATLTKQVSLKVVIEHNGLLAIGPKTAIDEIKSFLKTVDIPPAMVLFDVLVVDYTTTDFLNYQLTMDNTGDREELPTQVYYPTVDVSATGEQLNDDLSELASRLGISSIGTLSDDFFIRLQILIQEGKANIQSRPQIASLCGHTASINVGTTQYYLLRSQVIHPSQETSVTTQTSERFETIEASMNIEVIPYVNESGELIVEIKPEFSTPAAELDPEVPPTINHRILKSTVRLKNGETVILGGLIQSVVSSTIQKFPILGSLPLLGPLFQNVKRTNTKSELMIYITPHVYYGSEQNIDLDTIIKK
jgi:type IV pilus assembly protein PilQ